MRTRTSKITSHLITSFIRKHNAITAASQPILLLCQLTQKKKHNYNHDWYDAPSRKHITCDITFHF